MNFCLLEEEDNHSRFILSTLISIDFIYKNYNVLIACSEYTKRLILEFPLEFQGNIQWLILEKLDDNNIRYAKNLLLSMRETINLFGEAIYIDCRINLINKIDIPDEIKQQGIGYVRRSVGYMSTNIQQKYIKNIFYVNDAKYLDIIEEMYSKNIDVWSEYDTKEYTNQELKEINTKFVEYDVKIMYDLTHQQDISYFLHHKTLVSTEDFFALNDKLKLKDINSKWQIPCNLIKERKNYIDIREYEELDVSGVDVSGVDVSGVDVSGVDVSGVDVSGVDVSGVDVSGVDVSGVDVSGVDVSGVDVSGVDVPGVDVSGAVIEEEDTTLVNISAVNIRATQLENQIIAVNKEMYSRLASYNIIYMLLVNLKFAKSKIEFVMPKRDGISIWDRTDDPPGLYELIDMITENSDYFGKVEAYVDYFSFNNFILTDKPSKYWLNNNVRKYTGFFLCNYDNSLDQAIQKIQKPSLFGFYYSDHPKLLEEISDQTLEKSKFCIEIGKTKIIEYELSKKKTSLIQKSILNYSSAREKLDIISQTQYVLYDKIDINLFANCLGLRAVPVIKNNLISEFKDKNIYMLKLNTNFVIESNDWTTILSNYPQISSNNYKFYLENIKHDKIANKLLNMIFNISLQQFNS